MGGELFLYWDKVEKIVIKIRELFPTTNIRLASNGLLLSKFEDKLITLCKKHYPCTVEITDHFTLFPDDIIAENYHKKLDAFLLKLQHTATIKWPISHLKKYNNTSNINWKTWLIKEEVYQSESTRFNVVNQLVFTPCYYHDNDKIKPYATNDPDGSYANGCNMQGCHLLLDSKLYKCSWFAFLPHILEKYNQLQDNDWQKYLTYQPVDLTNLKPEHLLEFEKSSHSAISLCDMCSNNPKNAIEHTKENVLPQSNPSINN